MVSLLVVNVLDRVFEPQFSQTREYKLCICFFSAKHTALRRKCKDWLARNQDNMTEWNDTSTCYFSELTLSKSKYGKVTVEECSYAIHTMKLIKSPGLDGLTVEFYRVFWNKLKYILTDVLNKGNDEQCLTYSQCTSILTLMFKKGDHLNLDNYYIALSPF